MGDSEDPKLPQDINGTDPQPESAQNPAEYPLHQNPEPFFEQHQDRQRLQLENISKLEDEDWEDRQFVNADLIDHHNTKMESDQIQQEYSAQFEKLSDEECYSWQNTTPSFDYYIPEPEYYNSDTGLKQ